LRDPRNGFSFWQKNVTVNQASAAMNMRTFRSKSRAVAYTAEIMWSSGSASSRSTFYEIAISKVVDNVPAGEQGNTYANHRGITERVAAACRETAVDLDRPITTADPAPIQQF
jgi:hypothetical protein